MSTHQAEWGTVTFFINDVLTQEPAERQRLEQKGITIKEITIRAILGDADLQLTDGRTLTFAGLFVAPTVTPASQLPAELGCDIAEGPMGQMIAVDGTKETTVRGGYACGDVAMMPHSVFLAVGDGAMAGLQMHRSLVWPDM